jgi:hypothetical protein
MISVDNDHICVFFHPDHGMIPEELDPDSAARVCASIFQGLVLQQAWDPKLDVGGYIAAVFSLIEALVRSPRQPRA